MSISSSTIRGLQLPACWMPAMMRPGMEPMYVLRWPRISASSWMPPRDTRTSFRPVAWATLMAMLVLPVPGGPTRQSRPPLMSGESCFTARYSRIRSFTLSRPKCSSSRILRALARSTVSWVVLPQGSSRQVSRYPRSTAASAEPKGCFCRRLSSFFSFSRTSSVTWSASMRWRYSSKSSVRPSSPSSDWMIFISSRR